MAADFEVTRKRIYDAATQGDVPTFQQLLQEDPYLLDVVSFTCSRNALHIATMCGQLGIVEEALRINPRLARSLDSQQSSPLHLAAEEGNVEIASKLLSIAPAMCWFRDCQGMNPVHIAAMNGHAEVLEELIRHDPSPAREKVDRGQTAMHFCVKHGQLRALQVLVNKMGELVRVEDDDGETVLLLAVRCKQVEIVQYLTENKWLEGNLTNSRGKTALQIAKECRGDTTYSEITKILIQVAKINLVATFRGARDIAMMVVIMIAGMAFQATISPPGGVWQDDSPEHKAGTSIMASKHPQMYEKFIGCNTIAFTMSVITILCLSSVPHSSINFSSIATVWIGLVFSMSAFYYSYAISTAVLTPNTEIKYPRFFLRPAISMYLCMMSINPYFSYILPRLSQSPLMNKLRQSPLMNKLRVASQGLEVIYTYCADHLRKLSSFIDKYVWQIQSGDDRGVYSNATTTT